MNIDFNEENEFRLLQFIQKHYGQEVFTPGLVRTEPLFAPFVELGRKAQVKVTIIAGSNGKGQTAHTLCYLLENAQLKTALWTSPHILSLRERFQFGNEPVSYLDLEQEIYLTHNFLKSTHPKLIVSFYEFLFLVFLRMVFREGTHPDHLLLEVGLGGRLDAVNHFDADCTCITSISRDHQAILGNRYDQILFEKIAVSRKGVPLFTQFKLGYLNELTDHYCNQKGALWRNISSVKSGNYFEENQHMAQEIFSFLEPAKKRGDLESVPHFRGRREEMTFKGNTLIFIGAHNIDGIRRMLELFSAQESSKPSLVLLSFSKRPTNELEVMLKSLVDFFGKDCKLAMTSFEHPKALEFAEVTKLEKKFNKTNKGLLDFVTNWKTELQSFKNQRILVCGSYYFIGEVQRFIHKIS